MLSQWETLLRVFTYKMAAKINWHRYWTKLRHCYLMYSVATHSHKELNTFSFSVCVITFPATGCTACLLLLRHTVVPNSHWRDAARQDSFVVSGRRCELGMTWYDKLAMNVRYTLRVCSRNLSRRGCRCYELSRGETCILYRACRIIIVAPTRSTDQCLPFRRFVIYARIVQ